MVGPMFFFPSLKNVKRGKAEIGKVLWEKTKEKGKGVTLVGLTNTIWDNIQYYLSLYSIIILYAMT